MQITRQATDSDGQSLMIVLDSVPDTCPRCHRSVAPRPGQANIQASKRRAQVVYQCTSDACLELFIGTYELTGQTLSHQPLCRLRAVSPIKAEGQKFSEPVVDVSAAFVEIYDQAIAAEAQDLTQLVGIGLRKALEFLIKDFSVHQHPDDAEKIKGMLLSSCINAYVTDQNVKDCAKRAAWLGNDETHYIRKWEDKDISDLKLLVRLTTNWIENVLLTQKYVAEMPQAA